MGAIKTSRQSKKKIGGDPQRQYPSFTLSRTRPAGAGVRDKKKRHCRVNPKIAQRIEAEVDDSWLKGARFRGPGKRFFGNLLAKNWGPRFRVIRVRKERGGEGKDEQKNTLFLGSMRDRQNAETKRSVQKRALRGPAKKGSGLKSKRRKTSYEKTFANPGWATNSSSLAMVSRRPAKTFAILQEKKTEMQPVRRLGALSFQDAALKCEGPRGKASQKRSKKTESEGSQQRGFFTTARRAPRFKPLSRTGLKKKRCQGGRMGAPRISLAVTEEVLADPETGKRGHKGCVRTPMFSYKNNWPRRTRTPTRTRDPGTGHG